MRRCRPPLAVLAAFSLTYVLAGGFGQWLTIVPGVSITLWPPAGLFSATLLLSPRYSWPWWVLAGLVAELTCNLLWFHNLTLPAIGYFAANAAEAATGALLMARFFGRPPRLETTREVAALAALGAGVAPLVGATLGCTLDAMLGKHTFAVAWPLWWLGDATGVLLSAPLLLVAMAAWRERASISRLQAAEALALALILVGLTGLAMQGVVPTVYVVMPALLWAAVRFRFNGAVLALLLTALVTSGMMMAGVKELAGDAAALQAKTVMLQTFLAVSAISTLLVAALASQNRQALQALQEANRVLDVRVAKGIESLEQSQRRLMETARLASLASRAARIGTWSYDVRARHAHFSDELLEVLGYSREELNGSHEAFEQLMHPDDIEQRRRSTMEVETRGGEFSRETRIRRKEGGWRWILTRGKIVVDEECKPGESYGVSMDITERKEAEQALAASEAEFKAMFSVSTLGKAQVEPATGRFLKVNKALCVLLGYSEEQLLQRSIYDVTHPDDQARDREGLRRMATGETPSYEVEKRYVRKDGGIVWAHLTVNPIRDVSGQVMRNTAVIQDISKRKRTEEQLQASRKLLQAALDVAEIAPWGWDNLTGMALATERTRSILGLPQEAQITRDVLLGLLHPDDVPRFEAAWATALDPLGAQTFSLEYRIRRPGDGMERWISAQASVDILDGKPARVSGAMRDITTEKRATERMQMLMREVNHRSKNMLALVQAIARQTARGPREDFAERFAQRLRSLGASQDVLVNSEWQDVPLPTLIRSQLAYFGDLLDRRIRLEGGPVSITPAAAQTLGMAVHELATNASKHGALSNDSGRVVVRWRIVPDGEGVPIFSIEWQESGGPPVSAPLKRGFGSTVLSQLTKAAVDGAVQLDYPSEGFRWRLSCDAARIIGGAALKRRPAGDANGDATKKCRVLVVEDDAVVALDVAETLAESGFEVAGPAPSVARALDLIERAGCDVAVLDINLGSETSAPVAQALIERGTPFVAMSGYSREQLPAIFAEAPLMSKPVVAGVLASTLRAALQRHTPAPTSPSLSAT